MIDIDSLYVEVENISLVEIFNNPFYWINNKFIYNAKNGDIRNEITEQET